MTNASPASTGTQINVEALMASPERFLNRELSWLRFNWRIIEETRNAHHPPLERLRFLSISASNLDEFYMVRVAGLRAQLCNGVERPGMDGLTPAQQLEQIDNMAVELMTAQQEIWRELQILLKDEGVELIEGKTLTAREHEWLRDDFLAHILPVITPLAIDPAHPFPFIPNLGFALMLKLKRASDGRVMNAMLPMPTGVKRFVEIPTRDRDSKGRPVKRFITLERILTLFMDALFPSFELVDKGAF